MSNYCGFWLSWTQVLLSRGVGMDFAVGSAANGEDILALYERLRSEKLVVSSEHEVLSELNQKFRDELAKFEEQLWI